MKIAEALAIRKDTQKKIEQLKSRLLSNVRIQEGDEPSENPDELKADIDKNLAKLSKLIFNINKTNMHTEADGKTLTEMMAERDVLTMRVRILRDIFNRASQSQDRYSRSEIKMMTTVDIKALGHEIDQYSKKLRELDMKIQTLNFTKELED